MNTRTVVTLLGPALAGTLLGWSAVARAAALEGEVTLDYFIAEVTEDGFELPGLDLYAERVTNEASTRTGPLSLAGWLTRDAAPSGAGEEVGTLAVGSLDAHSALLDVSGAVWADDAAPGEYHVHALLQDEDHPGTYDDARSFSPTLLWRGGLEARGPLELWPHFNGTSLSVDFAELRNNRNDARYTNPIVLTLYATREYGPAATGQVLCQATIPAIYAGDWRYQPGFDCNANALADGEYTVHLMVAESGGRGGYSTLSGPDILVYDGRIEDAASPGCCGETYVAAGALDTRALLAALLLALLTARTRQIRRRAVQWAGMRQAKEDPWPATARRRSRK